MGCDSQQAGCSTGAHRHRCRIRSRVGVLLCLLAFACQLVIPAVHMWEVAAERGVVAVDTPASPLLRGSVQPTASLSAIDHVSQRVPHDPALCSVCQALSRLQVGMLMQSWITALSAPDLWLAPSSTAQRLNLSLSATAPRAPPSLS